MSTLTRNHPRRSKLRHFRATLTALVAICLPMAGALAQALGGDGVEATSAVAAVVKVPSP